MKKICLGDFWFYRELPDRDRAVDTMVDSFELLFDSAVPAEQRLNLFQSLLQLLREVLRLENPPHQATQRMLDLVDKTTKASPGVYLPGTPMLRSLSCPVDQDDQFSVRLTLLLMYVQRITVDFWQKTTDTGTWIAERPHLFADVEMDSLEKTLGDWFFEDLKVRIGLAATWEERTRLPMHPEIADRLISPERCFNSLFTSGVTSGAGKVTVTPNRGSDFQNGDGKSVNGDL